MSESSASKPTALQSPLKLTRLMKSYDIMIKNKKGETNINDVLMLWFQLFRRMINNLNNISNDDSKIRVIISQQLFSNDGIYNQNSNSHFDDNQFCFLSIRKISLQN